MTAIEGRPPLRLTRRGRIVLWTLVLVLFAGVGMWGGRAIAGGHPEAERVSVQTVAPGDTVWQFARRITPRGGDVRDTVEEIKRLNGLDSGALMAGQRLLLPAE